MSPEAGSSTQSTGAATDQAIAALKRANETAEMLRQRSDLAAKVLAAAGSTVVTAVGIAKFSDIWPLPPASWKSVLAVLAVIFGFSAMAFAVLSVAYRYWRLNRYIPFRSDLSLVSGELSEEEQDVVCPLFDELADLNDVDSVAAYEARAHRLERIAKWLPKEEAELVRGEAALIQTEVLATFARARVRVLRDRVTTAVRGSGAVALYVLFGIAVVAFGLGADWLHSERTETVTVAKACADARAVATVIEKALPDICLEPTAKEEVPSMVSVQISEATEHLAAALTECLAVADSETSCEPIKEAMSALLSP
jgi:hypothetical protein